MFDLKNCIALVTGSTGGIGASIARFLAKCGAQIAVSGTRTQVLGELCAQIENETETKPVSFACQLDKKEQVENLIPSVVNHFGRLDILVNNAGITADNLLLRLKDDEWDRVINVNLTSVFQLSRAACKQMLKQRYGRIVQISSVVGFTGNPGQTNYCATKAGILGFSKALSLEVASRNITVNCVAPGFIDTNMTRDLPETAREKIMSAIPMKKMGEAKDVAHAVAFLCARETSYMTGQTLHVNGGMYMV